MAILNSVLLAVNVFGDGTTTQFKLDLTKDCYSLIDAAVGAPVINWTPSANIAQIIPSDVGYSGTIAKSVITTTYNNPPPANQIADASYYLLLNPS